MRRWLLASALLPAFAATPGFAQYYAQPPGYVAQGSQSDLTAQLVNRVTALEDQVRQLSGRVDELQNALNQTNADLGKRIDDMRFQAQNGAGAAPPAAPPTRIAANTPPSSPGVPPPAAPQPTGPRTPEVALQQGYADIKQGDYASAQKAAEEVLSKRNSPRAYDAQYLLAQSLAGQHQWSRAAIAYDDAYNRSPKGGHAQTALLGLAISMTAINEKRAACETISKLHTQFPKLNPELQPQVQGVVDRAGCK